MSDLIDRQAAIEIASDKRCGMNFFDPSEKAIYEVLSDVIHDLFVLPSAQPERKKGKWRKSDIHNIDGVAFVGDVCSVCGWWKAMGEYNYCPNCGSYNGGEQHETD